VDLARYSKDTFKRTLGDLAKYEDYVVEISETKQIRGGKLPAIIYTIIIMDPNAVDLKELEKMKKQQGPKMPPPDVEIKGGKVTHPKQEQAQQQVVETPKIELRKDEMRAT